MAKKSKRKQRREAPDPFPDDLLGPLMRTLPDVFESEVLSKLTWLDAYKIACVNRECRETMEDIEAVLFMRTDGHVKTFEEPHRRWVPMIFMSMIITTGSIGEFDVHAAAGAANSIF
jgi:hypothetical protein